MARGVGWLGGEVGVEQLRLKLTPGGLKLGGIPAGKLFQPGLVDESMPQSGIRRSQREHAEFDTAAVQFSQFGRDERLRELRKDIQNVADAVETHALACRAVRSLFANATARRAFASQV
jgi:hypothetical protein